MSSLNATQADGYYVPPEYFESGAYKKQSVSKFAGSKGHNQYLQRSVVRFELPFDGFCTHCSAHAGKGTRFNAHKAHVDDYFTTKIYEFTTKCRACAHAVFRIRTNPKDRTFDYTEGIRKKVEEFDTSEAGTVGVIDTDAGPGIIPSSGPIGDGTTTTRAAGADNNTRNVDSNLSRLERTAAGERKAQQEYSRLELIQRLNDATTKDDVVSNANLRTTYRKTRQRRKRRIGDAEEIGLGHNIELVETTAEDDATSRKVFAEREVIDGRARKRERYSFQAVRSGSIFDNAKKSKSECQIRDPPKASGTSGIKGCSNAKEKPNNSGKKMKRLLVLKSPLLHCPGQLAEGHHSRPEAKEAEDDNNKAVGEGEMPTGLSKLLTGYGSDSSG
mmetsp:Transcript_4538/g.10911  ORF Transcript_4538/g.10911 Transcript_4538/m.10911 type:complete len:387 (-) Transcript_4538:64-1224(-)